MVKKCKECKGIMWNQYTDTCQTCREAQGETERVTKPQSKYVFTWDEYNMLLKNKVKQGLTYEEAKRELSFENRISNKKIAEQEKKKKEDEEKITPDEKFKKAFSELSGGGN